MISIFPLSTFHLYVATFQQHLQMEYISLSWYDIPELDRGLLLTRKLLNQGFLLVKLKSSLRKFYGRHHDLVDRCGKYVPQITPGEKTSSIKGNMKLNDQASFFSFFPRSPCMNLHHQLVDSNELSSSIGWYSGIATINWLIFTSFHHHLVDAHELPPSIGWFSWKGTINRFIHIEYHFLSCLHACFHREFSFFICLW
jgi:hypothetical protein